MTRPTFEHFNQQWADKAIGRVSKEGIAGYLGLTVSADHEGKATRD